jgi:tRNA G18 (ribose-2'-O)-methylase SpoU
LIFCLDELEDSAVLELVARAESMGLAVRRVGPREMRRLAPSGDEAQILAFLGPAFDSSLAVVMQRPGVMWLLVACAYPSNAGVVIRSAEVSGAAGVVIASDFDRVARRDCLRYAMRVDRFFPVHFERAKPTLALAREAGRKIVAVEDVGKHAPWHVDLRGPLMIVVGGEEGGVPGSVLAQMDEVVRVPMHGFLPSYNLQSAMAVVMGERLRQEDSADP